MLGNRDDNCIKQERENEGRGSLTASLNGAIDGMVRTPQARKALWAVAFVLVIAALMLGIRLTYSAFSANDHLKAVAVTGASQSLFASDVLAPYSTAPDSPAAKSVVVDTSGETCSFTFRVYNCMLDDRNVFNDKEVEYKLDVKASGINGDEGAHLDVLAVLLPQYRQALLCRRQLLFEGVQRIQPRFVLLHGFL